MDVEEISRRHLAAGTPDDDIVRLLSQDILTIKRNRISPAYAEEFARAVLTEAKNSTGLAGDLFTFEPSGSTMGEFGVGSRGAGDFFAHRQLARIIGRTSAAVGVDEMDDAGAVRAEGDYIITTVDGMHSRLSDFPFLAGFHVTRATLRDVYVMGAKPVALLSDIHVADDGDVAKIFDYTAGVTAVGEAMGVPLVTGSTLRIGGDMVLGSRLTGCVGAVGVARHLTARKQIEPGDVLLMTEGAGGGTIATAAIYSGFPEVVEETINLHFLKACEALLASSVLSGIHAMTDVTNGGLRGDAYEMAETAGCRIVVVEDELRTLVQPKVLKMLDALEIDYLGVSLDALLVVAPPELAPEIRRVVGSAGVAMKEIGYVEEGKPESVLKVDGEIRDFSPRFRESAYTPVKKVVDGDKRDFEEMKIGVERAAEAAIAKKDRVLARLRSS
ncbi:AIR synthase-related protein [Methanoculleus sp. 7T]|uniref:AIR synthase-related protein n=1 Tax=Methanoculleus sp. 7T TaxID=2937282 RepID=UPI0020BDA4F6|nr:AIR synthase-related protein [Methanoculleus sp. 7T]MCK8519621.1 AIR synthase-related protein [Methanoculleus sp. 7T]